MQPMSPILAAILAAQSRDAVAEIIVQGPNPLNTQQIGSMLMLDGVTKVSVQRNEDATADTVDYEIANPDGRYSPIRGQVAPIGSLITTDSYPDALRVGSVQWLSIVYLGLRNDDNGDYQASLLPQGTFLLESVGGNVQKGTLQQTAHGFDISYSFDYDVTVNLPHTLFGNQTDPRYDPNYNLSNPSGDLKTYVCDAQAFMTALTDNLFLVADYTLLFGQTASNNSVNVYVGSPTAPASAPVSATTYTWYPATGTVVFSSAQASDAIISIDGVPQAMAPEKMLYHLFSDYGHYNPSYFRFQTSNILLPVYTGGTDTVWHIAQIIAGLTAPRGVSWRLRIDEYGYIQFYEDKYATTPTETLVDERDFFSVQYTYSAEKLANVVRASSVANNQQPIVSISYDIDSINENGQRSTLKIDSSLLTSTRGAPPLFVKSMLDTLTASTLMDNINPTLQIVATVPANPAREVGDKVTVIEQMNGLSGPYIIKGITRTAQEGKLTEQLRLQKAMLYANYNIGLPAAVTNTPAPGTIGSTGSSASTSINATVTGRTGILDTITIGTTNAFSLGAVVKDSNGTPIIPIISGASWQFGFNIFPTQNYDTAIFQCVYLECPNTLTSDDIMVMRAGSWVANDGVTIPAATIAAGYSQSYTHTTGSQLEASETAYLYSNLVFMAHPNILPTGYAASYADLTYLSTTGLNISGESNYVGLGYGTSYTGSYAWLPQNKMNYGWYVVIALNAAGASQMIRCPFILQS